MKDPSPRTVAAVIALIVWAMLFCPRQPPSQPPTRRHDPAECEVCRAEPTEKGAPR